jgi:Ca2+-binding EF-hand superfamily protein
LLTEGNRKIEFFFILNKQLNSGYIAFRTAFEYIDPDNYGHLLNQEFEAVLKEFDIEFKNNEYSKFLKQYEIIIAFLSF